MPTIRLLTVFVRVRCRRNGMKEVQRRTSTGEQKTTEKNEVRLNKYKKKTTKIRWFWKTNLYDIIEQIHIFDDTEDCGRRKFFFFFFAAFRSFRRWNYTFLDSIHIFAYIKSSHLNKRSQDQVWIEWVEFLWIGLQTMIRSEWISVCFVAKATTYIAEWCYVDINFKIYDKNNVS